MLLIIISTNPPATDLGYLLHKNPRRCQTCELPFDVAHVYVTTGPRSIAGSTRPSEQQPVPP